MAGGGSEKVTIGFRYFMGVHIALSHGPVDAIRRIFIGEREAWNGNITSNTTININKPELFGGEKREGGVKGDIDVLMGGNTQARNTYLAKHQNATCPAYRGIASLIFKSFMWSAMNPYFKAPWVEATRVLKGWQNDAPWNPSEAYVGNLDMNPAHMIYQCLTDQSWGMGYTAADIGATFTSAAHQLKLEGFGLSMQWESQTTVEDFIKVILNHINANLALDLVTGKFELRLIRDDYDVASLVSLNESNIIELKSFQRAAYGDSANEVVVTYTDREQNKKTIAVQDLASIQSQGGVISTSREYLGIREPILAARVALRDLKTLSAPLAQTTIVTNRVLWDQEIGDVVKLYWSSLGVNGVVFRILEINKGTLTNGQIEVKMIEDIFGLPLNNYTSTPPSQWVDTVVPPIVADTSRVVEASHWDIIHTARIADQAYFEPGYGFGLFMAGRGAVQSTLGYKLMASPDDVAYAEVGGGNFNPTGTLVGTLTRTAESFSVSAGYDLDSVVLADEGGYCLIDDECMSVISCDPNTGFVQVGRGVLDTVPQQHAPNARIFFITPNIGLDPTERTAGETVYYRPLPQTGMGTLPLEEAETEVLLLNNRASRPYPPGNLKVGGAYYPVTIPGPAVTVTWSHRNRLQQTIEFFDYNTGNIGPEPGTTYVLRLYNGATLLHTYEIDGTATSWKYPTAHDNADGNPSVLTVKVWSKCNGLESLQTHDHTFQRNVVGGNVGIEGPPAAPSLSTTDWYFAVRLSWVPGDSRTNISKFEIRVADVPDITKSTVLAYVNYPTTTYEHMLGSATAFRWYWVRTLDVNGQMSAWSNIGSARALATDPVTMLEDINELLTDASGTHRIELIADRFAVIAPDGDHIPFALVEKSPGKWAALLNSEVLIGGNVNIANLAEGALPNDVTMRLGGGVIELDGAGEIRVFKDLQPNADFVRLSSGEIRFLRYIGGAYQTYNYLSRLETGQANSGTTVTIPGYWKAQPRVMVSAASLQLYNAAYANQSQSINCQPTSIQETVPGSGVYRFTATATLTLAANAGTTAINQSSGATSTNTYSSTTQATPANCTQITPSIQVQSQRGNGGGKFYYRSIRWRVDYWNGSAWVNGTWRVVNMGAQFAAISDAQAFNFPGAGTWQWRLTYEAYDTDGTVFGTVSYTYSEETISTNTGEVDSGWLHSNSNNGDFIGQASPILQIATSTQNTSWEIYEISYVCDIYAEYDGTDPPSSGYRFGYVSDSTVGVAKQPGLWESSYQTAVVKKTGSNLTYNRNYLYAFAVAGSYQSGSLWRIQGARAKIRNGRATIKRRTLPTNSTTPSNTFNLISNTYLLTSAQVLASGTLNWIAIGE